MDLKLEPYEVLNWCEGVLNVLVALGSLRVLLKS